MRDLHERHAGLRGSQVGEPQTAGHDALLNHRRAVLGGRSQDVRELLGALGLDADVVQTRPAVSQEVTIDIRAADRCDQL